MVTTIAIVAVVIVLILIVAGIYNNLVKLRNNRENAFADIDVQLKQRYDLVPQLVATVKGYAEHEKGVLENITAARSAAMNATSIDDKIKADQQLTSALAGLKVQVEAYPDLKANQNFMQLQGELADIDYISQFRNQIQHQHHLKKDYWLLHLFGFQILRMRQHMTMKLARIYF